MKEEQQLPQENSKQRTQGLKLKKKFEGIRITKKNKKYGKITFDAYIVLPQHYENYAKRGFEELFEEIIKTVIDIVVDKI